MATVENITVKTARDIYDKVMQIIIEETGVSFERIIELAKADASGEILSVVHAKWGEYESFPLTPSMNGYPCSNCGMHFSASAVPILKYCPNCGAKMDFED